MQPASAVSKLFLCPWQRSVENDHSAYMRQQTVALNLDVEHDEDSVSLNQPELLRKPPHWTADCSTEEASCFDDWTYSLRNLLSSYISNGLHRINQLSWLNRLSHASLRTN